MLDMPKTTSHERVVIDNSMSGIMNGIEQALDLLCEAEDEYFSDAEQKPLDEGDAQRVGLRVKVASNILYDACAQYGLVIGMDNWRGTKFMLEQMDRAQRVFRVEGLASKISVKERTMSEEMRRASIEARRKLDNVPDEQAEAEYQILLGGSK